MMQKANIDRSWARPLTDEEFQHEFMRRFPRSDVLPSREGYLCSTADAREEIRFPSDEDFERDTGLAVHPISDTDAAKLADELEAQNRWFCIDCPPKPEFPNKHALDVHRGRMHKKEQEA